MCSSQTLYERLYLVKCFRPNDKHLKCLNLFYEDLELLNHVNSLNALSTAVYNKVFCKLIS